jgi:hypothetical protein
VAKNRRLPCRKSRLNSAIRADHTPDIELIAAKMRLVR